MTHVCLISGYLVVLNPVALERWSQGEMGVDLIILVGSKYIVCIYEITAE